MSKKIYMKPGIETVMYNNYDDNMAKTYLAPLNYNSGNIQYSTSIKNTFTLHQ